MIQSIFIDKWRATLISGLLILLICVLWEVAGRLELIAQGALPALTRILYQIWQDKNLYADHIPATVKSASLGFLGGAIIGIAIAVLFVLIPFTQRLFGGFFTSLFSIPLIVLVPIIALYFEGETPKIVLAGLLGYYPVMENMLLGLRNHKPDWADLIHVYGGRRWMVFSKVRFRSGLANLLSGLCTAVPGAMLGTMLGELAGTKKGLGYFLLASTQSGSTERIWGVCVISTALTFFVYKMMELIGSKLEKNLVDPEPHVGKAHRTTEDRQIAKAFTLSFSKVALSVIVTLLIWEWIAKTSGLPFLVKGPTDVFKFLLNLSGDDKSSLLLAFWKTLPISLAGLGIGVLFALLLAVLFSLRPPLGPVILPFALITQTIPLMALTSIIVLTCGRGLLATISITISVSFFPAFAIILQGLRQVSPTLIEIVKIYNSSELVALLKVRLPSAIPFAMTAARLVASRVLMGVVLAEYLATYTGIGSLLLRSRGSSAFTMIWTLAFLIALSSMCFHALMRWLEQWVMKYYGFEFSH